ncbi:MAG: pantetheine-phosphate adenylyltransferase [Methanomassiliicoccales archaeon]|nr:pantetheine-phosphate adenylyltransferase [Methanomassiliicoccales archaeon]
MKVGVGGTFNVLHRGHRRLLDTAIALNGELSIGLMSDDYCRMNKTVVLPYEQREKVLREYLESRTHDFQILPLNVREGSAPNESGLEALVVSEETQTLGPRINDMRSQNGLGPVRIIVVPYVLADDYRPISSTRILSGEIDVEGRLLRPLKVAVGSLNPVKIAAVRDTISRFHPQLEIAEVDASGLVSEQPWGKEAEEGAMVRARSCLGTNDLGIGIEAGVWEKDDGLYDIQYCAIVDQMGRASVGHGMGFRYPLAVAELVRQGSSVGAACAQLFEEGDQGSGMGAIGILTNGAMDRKMLTEQAVMAAMVPRIRKDLY